MLKVNKKKHSNDAFTSFFCVCIVDIEQVNLSWDINGFTLTICLIFYYSNYKTTE